jgi:hypothetical protein
VGRYFELHFVPSQLRIRVLQEVCLPAPVPASASRGPVRFPALPQGSDQKSTLDSFGQFSQIADRIDGKCAFRAYGEIGLNAMPTWQITMRVCLARLGEKIGPSQRNAPVRSRFGCGLDVEVRARWPDFPVHAHDMGRSAQWVPSQDVVLSPPRYRLISLAVVEAVRYKGIAGNDTIPRWKRN